MDATPDADADAVVDPDARTTAGSLLAIVATTALAAGSVPLGYVVVMLTGAATLLAEGQRGQSGGPRGSPAD